MKTLEAIQYLLDNPEESVEETSATLACILKNENGCIMMYNKTGERYGVLTLTEEKLKSCWQVVKKPPKKVGWQEAIQAWINGKDFSVEVDGLKRIYRGKLSVLEDNFRTGICKREFEEGKFYIEN